MINTSKVININNTNVHDNNDICTNEEQDKNQQNNKTNSNTGEKQILEEENIDLKLLDIYDQLNPAIKKDPNPKHQIINKRTRTQHQKIRKQPATEKHDHPKFKKRPTFIFACTKLPWYQHIYCRSK